MCIKFIDVYDGDDIQDFQALKNQGIEGIVTKVLQGCTGKQQYYDYRYRKCKEFGIPVGFYHWLSSKSNPITQAEIFYNLIKCYNMDILPMLDIEAGGENWCSSIDPEDYANKFLNRFKELSGLDMLIYSGRCFIEENFSSEFQKNNLWWIAEYNVNCRVPENCKDNFVAWQHSEHGVLEGMNTEVDLDYLYKPEKFYIKDYTPKETVTVSYTRENTGNDKVRELQHICNLDGAGIVEDGLWGPNTDNAVRNLPPAGLPYRTPNLTKWVQLRVGCSVDGIYGQVTEQTVKGWQSIHGLVVDGIAGYNTIKSLALA